MFFFSSSFKARNCASFTTYLDNPFTFIPVGRLMSLHNSRRCFSSFSFQYIVTFIFTAFIKPSRLPCGQYRTRWLKSVKFVSFSFYSFDYQYFNSAPYGVFLLLLNYLILKGLANLLKISCFRNLVLFYQFLLEFQLYFCWLFVVSSLDLWPRSCEVADGLPLFTGNLPLFM